MKKIILLVILFGLISCSSSKHLQKSDVKSEVKTDVGVKKQYEDVEKINVNSASDTSMDKKTDSSENTSKIKETKVTDYDPSKPIVPGTGKPPVIKETVTTEKEDSQKSDKTQETLTQRLNVQLEYNKQLEQKVDSQEKVISSMQSKMEVKETPVISWWKWLFVGLGVGSVLTLLTLHFKWYVIIWSWIKKIILRQG